MNTEITDVKAKRGWVLYDGDCGICKAAVRRFGPALGRRGFNCVPLQTSWVRDHLNLSETELMLEMRVLEPSGNVVGGAAAALLLAQAFWWALPILWLGKLPGVFRLLDAAYRWGAARRYCANGACNFPLSDPRRRPSNESPSPKRAEQVRDSLPRLLRCGLLLLPFGLPFALHEVERWVLMWAMAAALWLALKLFTLFGLPRHPIARSLAYLAWPGLDASEFFGDAIPPHPSPRQWIFATFNITCGLILLFGAARLVYPHSTLLAGWAAMIGIVLILHFGVFKCLALFWQTLGIPATPIMEEPLRSRTLSEFWGRRWNTGFSIPARRYLMEPIARRFGTTAGVLAVFVVSGFVHELVISVPARAGYGLPTLYFLIQAAGLLWERGHSRNRFFTILCSAAPAFVLFHPPFIHRIIIPFLKGIGAL